jgi:hypothetical protein
VSAEEAEVLTCLERQKHLINLQPWPAIVETDCLQCSTHAVQMISSQCHDRSECWNLYREAQELMKVYDLLKIKKVDRVSNGAAHVLA